MAKTASFDVTSGVDLQEVDNAVNQAVREVSQRYDFKGVAAEVDFYRDEGWIGLLAEDEYRLQALADVLNSKLAKRKVPLKNLHFQKPEPASGGKLGQRVDLQQGIPQDKAKEIVKSVKSGGFKKVQIQIQDDQLRVQSPSRDELQQVIVYLKEHDFGVELDFGNFR
ncbi:MAG: YajQ family cyclic di-GMP-binding protein [Longimicrobiaceae bacterium]